MSYYSLFPHIPRAVNSGTIVKETTVLREEKATRVVGVRRKAVAATMASANGRRDTAANASGRNTTTAVVMISTSAVASGRNTKAAAVVSGRSAVVAAAVVVSTGAAAAAAAVAVEAASTVVVGGKKVSVCLGFAWTKVRSLLANQTDTCFVHCFAHCFLQSCADRFYGRRFYYVDPVPYVPSRTVDPAPPLDDCDISLVHETYPCATFVEETIENTFPWADVDNEPECDEDDDVCIVIPDGNDCQAYADEAVKMVETACLGDDEVRYGGNLRGYNP